MKKLLCLLTALLMLVPAAFAMGRDSHELTIPCELSPTGSITLTWYPGDRGGVSTADTWVQGLYLEEKWEEAHALNLLLAEAGDAGAMVRLGDHHLRGVAVPVDGARALAWYQRAWEAGDPSGLEAVALMYLNGWGVEADAAYAAGLLEELAEQGFVSPLAVAKLYLLGCGNLAPDMEKAMYWFDNAHPHERHQAQEEGERDGFYRKEYERKRDAFLATQTLPTHLTTAAGPQTRASNAMDMGVFWRDGAGGVVNHQEAARWFALAIALDESSGTRSFVFEWSHYALAEYDRDGVLGVIDPDGAIRHFAHARYYDRIAAMLRKGVTGPDGTVHLAPDTGLADAFQAAAEYRAGVNDNAVIGDLFRTGRNAAGESIVTPDACLAARFYYEGKHDPYCVAQLTEMYKAGLVTDPWLIYSIGSGIAYSDCDVSELILLMADDLIHGRVTICKPNADDNEAMHCRALLEQALSRDKLPDPQAAYDLLALIPEE